MSKRRNHLARAPQAPKPRRSAAHQAATLDLRQGSRTIPVPSGKVYNRQDRSWQKEW